MKVLRTVAPDLIGFGRSDKPAHRDDYTYQRHVDWIQALIDHMNLVDITLVCQDWGGLIGLRLLADNPGRFSRVVAANTGLPTGDQKMPDAFLAWRKFSQETPEFPVSAIVNAGCVRPVSSEVKAAYDAPFPDESYKEGVRIFPSLVPASPDDPAAPANRKAWEFLKAFDISRLHGINERIAVDNYIQMIKFYMQLITNSQMGKYIIQEAS